MSSILSGARPGRFDLEIVKSPSTSTYTSQTSSTLSESSNSQLAICTRKPRTPRKRPSQTYNEAAALLSTAYPTIFSAKHLTKPHRFTKPLDSFWDPSSSELLLPFRVIDRSGFLLHQPVQEKPSFRIERKPPGVYEKPCLSPGEIDSPASQATGSSSLELCDAYEEDFDTESMLDEEIEEGILDSIMGMSTSAGDEAESSCSRRGAAGGQVPQFNPWYGSPLGLGFGGKYDYGFGVRRGVTPLRQMDDGNWWCSPTVDVLQISPRFNRSSPPPPPTDKKKKRSERRSTAAAELEGSESMKDISIAKAKAARKPLLLKLNYEGVVNAWSDRGSPFPEELTGADAPESDVSARLEQIDLFGEGGGLREASMLRYKEKRRTRLFSKKIRYQVRKVNADRRPRMKGRFVRRPNGSTISQR